MKFSFTKLSAAQQLEPKISVPEIWSDEKGLALRGWILTPNGPPDMLEIVVDGKSVPVLSWHARPKIVAKYPEFSSGENCGFWAYLPRDPTHQVQVRARTGGHLFSRIVSIPSKANASASPQTGSALFQRFRSIVNNERLSVLEIGSRVVVRNSESKRALFAGAESYTGFDLYPDGNTDVVGDAHKLSSYFDKRFDAVFSLAVLEHLAMPWLAAMEINKVLRPGGHTFHQTHFAFPLHEQPADYWRFTDQGLRSLFSPAVGFGSAECEFSDPVSLHPEHRTAEVIHLPNQPAYIQVAVLARKTAELGEAETRWTGEGAAASHAPYPAPAGGSLPA